MTQHAVRAILPVVSSAVSILCAVVTVVCLLGVWGVFDRIRRDVERREAITAQLVAALRDALVLARRLGSVVERGEPMNRAERTGRGERADQ